MLEYLDTAHVRGWCLRPEQAGRPLAVKVYVCGVLVGTTRCQIARPDLSKILGSAAVGGFHFGWRSASRAALLRVLQKLRSRPASSDATSLVKVRIAGTLYTVSGQHLGTLCRPMSAGQFHAALSWIAQAPLTDAGHFPDKPRPQDKPILFVLHDTEKFGAQLFIVRFVEWLKRTAPSLPLEFLVTLRRPEQISTTHEGSLAQRIAQLGPVYYLDSAKTPENADTLRRGGYRLVYINSFGSLYCLEQVPLTPSPMVVHVHELHWAAGFMLDDLKRRQLREREVHFVACSSAVQDMLLSEPASIPAERVTLVHAFVPSTPDTRNESVPGKISVDTNQDHVPTVLIAGSVSWRKGGYLLGSIAATLSTQFGLTPRFRWVGALFDRHCVDALRHEFAQLGLTQSLDLTGHREDVDACYRSADLLLLPSIEDPFPLVMIEAGLSGLPIIAFSGSGGGAEFIGLHGGGITVPHLDTYRMAEAISDLLRDPARRMQLGKQARVTAEQFTDTVRAPRLLDVIQSLSRPPMEGPLR